MASITLKNAWADRFRIDVRCFIDRHSEIITISNQSKHPIEIYYFQLYTAKHWYSLKKEYISTLMEPDPISVKIKSRESC
ncbi:hypothetical protein DCM91_16205 [Chitinophaga costaii]|nr:hypothetical protein DCM91_16205 [Chitinophaga costaii]